MPNSLGISSFLPPVATASRMPAEPQAPAGPTTANGLSFEKLLSGSLEQVNELDRASQSAIAGALTGEDLTQAEVFTAVKKADLAFRTMLQIRNKLVEAYNELKNMRM